MTVIVHQSKPQSIDDLIELAQECLDKLAVLDTLIAHSSEGKLSEYLYYASEAQEALKWAKLALDEAES